MNCQKTLAKFRGFLACLFPGMAFANTGVAHTDPVVTVIFWVTLIFFFGVLGRYFAKCLHQPKVLGELLMGVLVGNVCYFFGMPLAMILRQGPVVYTIMADILAGNPLANAVHANISNPFYAGQIITVLSGLQGIELIKTASVVDIFSRYGVIFLLFMVGLDSSMMELKRTGVASFRVAVIGVVAPILLGIGVSFFLMPEATFRANLFVAATLCATSVGITASVLKEMKKLNTREARTILGAAMIDDILGLVILAIVSSIVVNGLVSMGLVANIVALALVFFAGVLWAGPWVLQKSVQFFHFLEPWEEKLLVSFLFLMFLSWLATVVHLATIIGAFAAGVILHDGFFKSSDAPRQRVPSIKELVAPLESILAPLFFMLIGIQVKIEAFYDKQVLLMAGGLVVAAILGKLVSGLGAARRDDRLLIGIGMLPRGEVGLVFASIGETLGVISDQVFSAIILMVIVTTFIAPPWVKARFKRHEAVTHDAK